MRLLGYSEIQILREPIGLEIALLKACSPLEYLPAAELIVCMNARQQPSKRIVLLDNVRLEPHLPA